MKIGELTIQQLVNELNKRPIHFVLCWWEDVGKGCGNVVSSLPDQDVIGTLETAIDYVCQRSDSWGNE